ncbi:Cupredoxin [Amylocarpus encephaloides]|uniref:Cupredoxin n=1 Tax=Amylocarpus encephaloides TaxID=45428 RepID=A0A9P8C243_9HELO|nr:Cupredoxin [Amylocarpus encephaloides]
MQFSRSSLLALIPALVAAETTTVTVGKGGSLTFEPSTAMVPVGGTVEFKFFPMKHSVAQGAFDAPCKPLSADSFWSGGFATSDPAGNATTFSITVKDDKPIYYYCAFPGHCGQGMVGIINPPSDTSMGLEAYIANAMDKDTVASTKVQGGTVNKPGAASSSSAAGNSSSPTSSGSAAPSASGAGGYGSSPPATSSAVAASGASTSGSPVQWGIMVGLSAVGFAFGGLLI